MAKKAKIWTSIFGLILLCQLIIFWDYIGPIHWDQIKVSGLACTCPDEKVINGQTYLRMITPDSLKKYDLNYSEIYVTDRPWTDFDPMGVDEYIIKGSVIGKERVSEYDPWNPVVKVEAWRSNDLLIDLAVKFVFSLQLLIFALTIRKMNKNDA